MTETCDAAVIGAGPAGSAAAAALASAGLRTLLVEKETFPRRKVCGAYLAADALPSLERLGATQAVLSAGPETIARARLHLPGTRPVAFDLPSPGLGLSRALLDSLLAARAEEAGAKLHFGARVVSLAGSRGAFRLRTGDGSEIRARAVIGAWGRWDALDRSLSRAFLVNRARYVAWNAEYRAGPGGLAGEVRLYAFTGGYCGLSRVEEGRVNLAGVVAERLRPAGGWEALLSKARRENEALDADLASLGPVEGGFLGAGPVFFTAKPPVEGGILMVGDAAGVVDPFSGEGQAIALASGLLAGETASRWLSGGLAHGDLAGTYGSLWRDRFAGRFAWSAVFRRILLSSGLGALGGRLAGRRLARFAVSRLRAPSLPPS
jgi:flavin-dependent dehydrogenase